MSERERFEQYMRDTQGDILLDQDENRADWYHLIEVRFAWSAWQTRADLAAEEKRELAGLLKEGVNIHSKSTDAFDDWTRRTLEALANHEAQVRPSKTDMDAEPHMDDPARGY